MASKFITINDAAEISNKSPQTIRRLIKAKKVNCRKIKTPQGFNYEIDRTDLLRYYGMKEEAVSNEKINESAKAEETVLSNVEQKTSSVTNEDIKDLMDNRSHKVLVEYAPVKEFNNTLQVLLKQHAKEKENLFKLVEAFQNKVVTLETKVKSHEDGSKRWYKFW